MIYTSANSHLGDCTWMANILYRIGGEHDFYVPEPYMRCIAECLESTDTKVKDIVHSPREALSSWIACGRFDRQGVSYRNQVDLVEYLMQWGNAISRECGHPHAMFTQRQEILCSFPAIRREFEAPEFEILIVNCPPLSGQAPGWDQGEMDVLIGWLSKRHKVLCTNPTTIDVPVFTGSICAIGNLSCRAKLVIAVSSGGAACIHNEWNESVPKMIFLHPIVLNYGRGDIHHFANCAEMTKSLHSEGWL